jgi:cytoskeletal protein CcmA (bactofilin family)
MIADHVVLDGTMEGPIECDEIVLKSNANVIGDIACESVMIEKGAFMEGRLMRRTNGHVRQALTSQPAGLLPGKRDAYR